MLLMSYMNCKCNDDYEDQEFACFKAARSSDHNFFWRSEARYKTRNTISRGKTATQLLRMTFRVSEDLYSPIFLTFGT